METNNYLKQFYENYDEDGRLLSHHGSVEFLTTVRYVEKYLNKGMKILEIGAATGRYSHYFARKGYDVDSVELLEHNIEIFQKNTLPDEKITIRQGNALDLSHYTDNTYDITLLLGPMYHLYSKEDQLKALSEAIRVTKKDGIVFVAYCLSDATVLTYGFVRGNIHKFVNNNMVNIETFETYSHPWDIFELMRKEDIDTLRKHFDVTKLHYIASDGYTDHMAETVDAMDKETFDLYLKYHFATCERQDMIGLSHHALDIFRKN